MLSAKGETMVNHQVESKIMIRVLLSIRHESVKCILDINQDIIKESSELIFVITRKKNF